MDEREQREMRKGAGDAFAAAFELIATPALFGLLGWFVDSRLGLFPVFTLVLVSIVLVYETQKLCVSYRRSLDEALEQRRATYGQGPQ
ncbi:MAG: AtpZ/AtpI family protein [Acidimicrobiaceae bacterium]|nr:AtpZ/AtpI family protein [Acidimicrobiaceae bacterium]